MNDTKGENCAKGRRKTSALSVNIFLHIISFWTSRVSAICNFRSLSRYSLLVLSRNVNTSCYSTKSRDVSEMGRGGRANPFTALCDLRIFRDTYVPRTGTPPPPAPCLPACPPPHPHSQNKDKNDVYAYIFACTSHTLHASHKLQPVG